MALISGLFLCNCSTNEQIDLTNPENGIVGQTRSQFHWRCPRCGMLNGGWRNYCSDPLCDGEYSVPHGVLILTILDIIKTNIEFSTGGGDEYHNPDIIELPNRKFPSYAPEPWYETSCAMKYYNELKNSSSYRLTPDYAEGVEFAWYRTVRSLYPKYHSPSKVELEYDKFIISEGRNLKGFKGQGIQDASKAAIKAFASCR